MLIPSLLNYGDYRVFLRDIYNTRKTAEKKYSFRTFAAEMGFQASNFLHLVVQGKRNLSSEAVAKIGRYFSWNAQQKKYFKYLVLENQAMDASEKKTYLYELSRLKKNQRVLLSEAQDSYFANWYVPVLREIVSLKGFVSNLNWISKKIMPRVSESLLQSGLVVLEKLGMIKLSQGKWLQVEEHLTTPLEVTSAMIYNYHRQMLALSQKALELPAEERDISAMTMSLSPEQFEKIKKRVVAFRDEIQQSLQDSTIPSSLVAQLNIQLFPVTKK